MKIRSEKMKVIYIAGPYRDSRGEFYVGQNIYEAEMAALRVWQMGGVALCPHKNSGGLGGAYGLDDRTWLEGDLELLRRCDAIYLITDWQSSAGVQAEKLFAEEIGIPVLQTERDVMLFLRGD